MNHMAPVQIDLSRYSDNACAWVHSTAYHAVIRGEHLSDDEIARRAVERALNDAQKRDGYRGPKAEEEAKKSREAAAEIKLVHGFE